jgi:hypothetical protein
MELCGEQAFSLQDPLTAGLEQMKASWVGCDVTSTCPGDYRRGYSSSSRTTAYTLAVRAQTTPAS